MGHYTYVKIRLPLKNPLPIEAKLPLALANVIWPEGYLSEIYSDWPSHAFFAAPCWGWVLGSGGTNGIPANGLLKNENGALYLAREFEVKNVDGVIEKFFDWVVPYVDLEEERTVGAWENDFSETLSPIKFSPDPARIWRD